MGLNEFIVSCFTRLALQDRVSDVRAGDRGSFADSLIVSIDMEAIDEVATTSTDEHGSRIMVSNTKKPLFHYVRLCEKFLAKADVVTLCGIGAAVASAASVSEILKQKGTVRVTRIHTGTVMHVDEQDPDARSQKSTIEIDLRKACLRNRSETDGR